MELREQLQIFSKLLGVDLNKDVSKEEEWIIVRDIIFSALEPFPEARAAIAEALISKGAIVSDV
jgi:hypothetical protein